MGHIILVDDNRVNISTMVPIHKTHSIFKEYLLITDKMNTFMSRITVLYLQYVLNPYRDMDKEIKRTLWILIILLGGFTAISLKPSLLNRPLGLKSI